MPPLSVLIKPASSACDMRCAYCFYRDEAEKREHGFTERMTGQTAETIIRRAFEFAEQSCTFMFQGGEPTLTGLDFFRAFIALEKQYNTKHIRVFNALQTNGLSIDDEWAGFFRDNRFLIGLSLDGPAETHNRNRKDSAEKDTFNRVMKAASVLDKHRVEYNVLCVVTAGMCPQATKLYHFFGKHRFGYLQFIPCLEPLGTDRSECRLSPTPAQYEQFLTGIFRLWYFDLLKNRYVSIRHIDNYIRILKGLPPESCNMNGRCGIQFVIEGNGDVYPCDFYALDEYRLGNVRDASFAEMRETEAARQFIEESLPVPEECRSCRFYPLCRNGCKRDRGADGKNYYCEAYKGFFTECEKELAAAAGMIR